LLPKALRADVERWGNLRLLTAETATKSGGLWKLVAKQGGITRTAKPVYSGSIPDVASSNFNDLE
jgi:hypothetical protein